MFGVGGWELLLIFVIVLLVFGAKRLPEIARSLGKATTEFKKAKNEIATLAEEAPADDETTASAKPAKPAAAEGAPAEESRRNTDA
jgi:sec-independent protein translocase protein TatA